jgi:hypothetical protein
MENGRVTETYRLPRWARPEQRALWPGPPLSVTISQTRIECSGRTALSRAPPVLDKESALPGRSGLSQAKALHSIRRAEPIPGPASEAKSWPHERPRQRGVGLPGAPR